MIISRQLRIALLISFFWHAFWIAAISIIFLPQGLLPRRQAKINFLGSILAGSISIAQSAPPATKQQAIELPLEAQIQQESYFQKQAPAPFADNKANIDPDSFINVELPGMKGVFFASFEAGRNYSLEREAIFKPQLPQYPEWTDSQDFRNSDIVFNVYISAEGIVNQVVNLQASGSPEIDAALARYLRKWRFTPAADQKARWQAVKINLDSKGENAQ